MSGTICCPAALAIRRNGASTWRGDRPDSSFSIRNLVASDASEKRCTLRAVARSVRFPGNKTFVHRIGYLPFDVGRALRLPRLAIASPSVSCPKPTCTGSSAWKRIRATARSSCSCMLPGCGSANYASCRGATCNPTAPDHRFRQGRGDAVGSDSGFLLDVEGNIIDMKTAAKKPAACIPSIVFSSRRTRRCARARAGGQGWTRSRRRRPYSLISKRST